MTILMTIFYDGDIEEDGGEIDLDISKIVDISLREKLVESYLLIEKINAFSLSPPVPISPIPISPTNYPSSTIPVVDIDLSLEEADVLSFSDNSITRGIESDRDSGEDTTSIDDLPLDDSMILPEYESFTFDDEARDGENVVSDEEEDTFTFTTRSFLPFVTYPEEGLKRSKRSKTIKTTRIGEKLMIQEARQRIQARNAAG
ncbi:hypothetical protein Tco_0015517 [Tanacetum coccineum]